MEMKAYPDFNSIERLWSKMKALIRGAKATTQEELDAALKRALASVSRKNIAGWFTHCGDPLEVADN
jgi:transposase